MRWRQRPKARRPDLAAPAAYHARLLLGDGRSGPAAKAVERAWRSLPHPELAQAYGEIHIEAAPLARYQSMERLAAQNSAAHETHLALAEAALTAELWGEARRHLEQAPAMPPGATAAALPDDGTARRGRSR